MRLEAHVREEAKLVGALGASTGYIQGREKISKYIEAIVRFLSVSERSYKQTTRLWSLSWDHSSPQSQRLQGALWARCPASHSCQLLTWAAAHLGPSRPFSPVFCG